MLAWRGWEAINSSSSSSSPAAVRPCLMRCPRPRPGGRADRSSRLMLSDSLKVGGLNPSQENTAANSSAQNSPAQPSVSAASRASGGTTSSARCSCRLQPVEAKNASPTRVFGAADSRKAISSCQRGGNDKWEMSAIVAVEWTEG